MADVSTARSSITEIYIAAFNRVPDTAGLEYWVDANVNKGVSLTQISQYFTDSTEYKAKYPTFLTNGEYVDKIYLNVFGRNADDAGKAFWVATLDNNQLTWGTIMKSMLDAAHANGSADGTRLTNQATFGVWCATNNANVTTASGYLAAITADPATVTTAQTAVNNTNGTTYRLTTGVDSFVGTAYNDTFDGSLSSGSQTLGSGDNLNGGAGTDTLNAVMSASASPTMSNVENISINASAGATFGLANVTGYTVLENNSSTGGALVFNGISSTTPALKVSNTGQSTTFTYTAAAVSGTADTATLTLSNVTAGTQTIQGIETLNIVSSGGANAVTALDTDNATKYVISGDQTLSLGTLDTSVLTVDASAATAGVTFTSNQTTASTITGGSGNDSFTMTGGSAVNDTINAGAGNDTITFTANLANTDSVDGGEGTDTLVGISANLTGYTKPTTYTITNIEKVKVSDSLAGDLTLANLASGVSTLELAAGTDNTQRTATFESGTRTVDLTGTTVIGASGVKFAIAGTAITDSLTINAKSTTAMFNAGEPLAVDGAETININATKVAEVIDGITLTNTMAAAQTVNFGGGFAINTTGAGAATISATTGSIAAINASSMTVATTAAGLSAIAGSATVMTGSAGRDSLTGSSGKDTISGGAGNDTIASGGGNDVISGGDGVDSITIGAAGTTASIDGGAGNDTITVSGFLAKTQTIGGGADTDILVINATDVTTFNALTDTEKATLKGNITGIEVLEFAANTGATLDVSTMVNTAEVTKYKFSAAQTDQISNIASGSTLEYTTASSNMTATVKNASTSASDVVTLQYTNNAGNVDFGTQTLNNIETINVTSNHTGTQRTHTAAISTDSVAGGMSITGNNNLVLTVSGATKLASVDASALTGTLNLNVSASTVASTLTLGSGNSTLVAGTGADSIIGGIGNDTIDGGSGNDTIFGGAGNDTITGNAGSDSISAGTGNDVIYTSAGTDTIDGGDGTDTLYVSSGVFNNITSTVLTSVETLNMNSLAVTMTNAQYSGFTTISNTTGGVVFSDAGTIAANAAVNTYTLANGTNTFNTTTLTSGAYAITGGTGSDTVNTSVANFISGGTTGTFAGGSGTLDVVNFTNNAAVTVTTSNISGVEKITFANTDTNIAFTTGDGMLTAAGVTEFDFSNLTTGTLNFNGSGETTGATSYFKILKGGTGNGTITGGTGADIILGGAGADTITGGAGNDSIDLTSGGVDRIFFNAHTTNGTDTISGFGTGTGTGADVLVVSTNLSITVPGALTAFTTTGNTTLLDNMIGAVNMAAAISGKAYTGADFGDIFAGAGKVINTATGGSVQGFLAVQGTDTTYLLYIDSSIDTTDTNITAADVKFVGILSDVTNGSTAFNIANFG